MIAKLFGRIYVIKFVENKEKSFVFSLTYKY